jgi:hypothetical protein
MIGRTPVCPWDNVGEATAKDAFSVVAAATGSPVFTEPVTLSRLWHSLPYLERAPGLGPEASPPLLLEPNDVGAMVRLPVGAFGSDAEVRPADVENYLRAYPAADDAAVAGFQAFGSERGVRLEWRSPDGVPRTIDTVGQSYLGSFYLRPAIEPGDLPPSVLMTWWALLLGLSSLARYEPAKWTAALDRDSSTLAVPIENALEMAQEIMPRLVLHAITNDWGYD